MYKRCKLERLSSVDCKRITKIYTIKQNINSDFTKFIYNYIQNKNYKGGIILMNNENDIFISSSTMMLEPCKPPLTVQKLSTVAGSIFTPAKPLSSSYRNLV